MAGKKKAASRKKSPFTVQRGGEKFALEHSADSFVVKRKRVGTAGMLKAVTHSPDRFPGLSLDEERSPRGLEVYHVEAGSRDQAMEELRKNSPDVEWCGHVYHAPDDPSGYIVPTDGIYAVLAPGADPEAVNALLDKYGLELTPDPTSDAEAFVLRLTEASKENPLKIANALLKSKAIVLAEPDLSVAARLFVHRPTDDLFPDQWHLENLGGLGLTAGADVSAPSAWDHTRGDRSVTVAVIDDGFDVGHPDFASSGKIRSPRDFGQGDFDASPVSSGDNHGTACAGVAVADENGSGVLGLAPECGLMPIRWSGFLSDADIRDQFDHARQNSADVISCSWGADAAFFSLSTSMKRSIHRAASEGRSGKGCVVLFAAGNDNHDIDGPTTRDGFALHPDVIAVAASNSRDRKSHYSNFGDRIWICAPSSGAGGLGIVTTDRRGAVGYQSGNYTTVERFGGTSSATPLAAGLCGLLLSANPDLTAEEVKEILRDTAEKIDIAGGNYDNDGHSRLYGYGRIDADRAVQEAIRRRGGSPAEHVVRFESQPSRAIPDRSAVGIGDAIAVNRSSSVQSVEVEVDITHTYRGDLRVTLVGPDGTAVRLFGRTAPVVDAADNLVARFTADDVPALDQFRGKVASGNWTLQVADLAAADTGTLNSWTLTLGLSAEQTEWESADGQHIPDHDANGISSEIDVDTGGALRNIAITVDITHTYRGDLRITLEPPAGSSVTLRSVDHAEGADDLRESYTPGDSAGLQDLVDQAIDIRGTWTLRVSDNLSDDVGKLNSWSLRLLR